MPLDFYDQPASPAEPAGEADRRPYICMLFECCRVYVRIYRHPEDDTYEGRCPKCLAQVRVRVGPDGKSTRFLVAR